MLGKTARFQDFGFMGSCLQKNLSSVQKNQVTAARNGLGCEVFCVG